MNKIEKVTADVQVAEQLKQWIVDQHLEAGDRLPTEAELCNEFGVARHTLREGIKRLSQLGIVESKTGSGTYIRESSYDKVEEYLVFLKDRKEISKQEIYDVRAALESIAAAAAAHNATDADIRQMEKILNRMKRSVEQDDYEKFVDCNVEFHNTVVSLSQPVINWYYPGHSKFNPILHVRLPSRLPKTHPSQLSGTLPNPSSNPGT